MASAPSSQAFSNAAMVFSGAYAEAPLWAMFRTCTLSLPPSRPRDSIRGMEPWFYRILRPWVYALGRLYFRIQFRGVNHVPLEGPLLIVSNHVSYADPIWLSIPIRRRITFMTWDRVLQVPGLGALARAFGAFPVRVEQEDRRAMRAVIRHLQAGEAVVIFPEGGRTTTGKLGAFKPGAFRLAVELAVPVVPVSIRGGYEVWPPNRRFPRPGPVMVIYHPPQLFRSGGEDPKATAREAAARVRRIIATALSPEAIPDDLAGAIPP